MRVLVMIVVTGALAGVAAAQVPGVWRNFTAMENVRAATRDGSTVWAGTPGGVFSVEIASRAIRQFTTAEGLSTNDVTAIDVIEGTVWIGAADGSMDLRGSDGTMSRITDIREAQRPQKRVRTFEGVGDTVLIGTDFGVSVYRRSAGQFGDTYTSFGFPSATGVNDVLVSGTEIWLATDRGVVRAQRFAPNLADPSAWQRHENVTGTSGLPVRALAVVRDTIVAATQEGAAFFTGTAFQPMTGFAGRNVADLATVDDALYALWNDPGGYTVQVLSGPAGSPQTVGSVPGGSGVVLAERDGAGVPWVGTTVQGVAVWTGTGWEFAAPNGPRSSMFTGLAVDRSGVLWTASGISGGGRGFSRYDPRRPEGSRWKNFTVIENPVMGSNDYHAVGTGTGSSMWISAWGQGVVEVAGDTIRRRLHTGSVPSFSSSDNSDTTYAVMNGVAADAEGGTWFVNWGARNRNFLARITADTSIEYFTHPITGQGYFTSIAIDRYGTKWLAGALPFHALRTLSLFYFNEAMTVPGTAATGGWGVMTESDGLPDAVVFSVAIDREGSVCVGTEHGFLIIYDPLYPRERRFASFPLREQAVQAIAVDAINNKWVGTKEGLFVMNPDATRILQQYTVSSTGGRLADNDIRALAIDQTRGVVYIGTERGLSSLSIEAVEPSPALTALDIGPNPFLLPASGSLEIRNLAEESTVKILRIDGALVTEFRAQGGGRARWDGRDRDGKYVSSGVYFVVAHAKDGEEVATTKVAVIRR